MNFDKLVETKIREAQERGEFNNLKGQGQPIDLSAYFETPEEVRAAYSMLKNAGMLAAEVELLQEIAAFKEKLEAIQDETERKRIGKILREKQLQFNMRMERQKRQRRSK